MSIYARLAALVVLVLAIAGAWWKLETALDAREQRGYERRVGEDKAAAEAQTSRNRELQRATELKYTVVAQGQDRFFVTTVREIYDASEPLAACPLPGPVRLRLNAAGACVLGDSAAACGGDDQMRSP